MNRPAQSAVGRAAAGETGWLELVRQQVGSLRYGLVQIVVDDGQVTQIEKTERMRLDSRERAVTSVGQPAASASNLNACSRDSPLCGNAELA